MLLLIVTRKVFLCSGRQCWSECWACIFWGPKRDTYIKPSHQGGEIRTRGRRGSAVKENTVSGQDVAFALRNPPLLWWPVQNQVNEICQHPQWAARSGLCGLLDKKRGQEWERVTCCGVGWGGWGKRWRSLEEWKGSWSRCNFLHVWNRQKINKRYSIIKGNGPFSDIEIRL